MAEELAAFAASARFEHMSECVSAQLKVRILDSLACAIGALDAGLMRTLRAHTLEHGMDGAATLIGGGRASVDRAAFFNGALVRYLDFNDSYVAPGETCHPSDNLAAVLAAAEAADLSGRELLVALAVAYEVQCRLCDAAPVRGRGFDHTTLLGYSVAAGVARALGLDTERTADAVAIAGTTGNALRVSRTGTLSNWKALAASHAAFSATHAVLLALRGVTGPREVFEGTKGFMESIAGTFFVDWADARLDKVSGTVTKAFNAEIHAQSAVDAALAIREAVGDPASIVDVDVRVFDVAYEIIGGGAEGAKHDVTTKEQADHSLPFMIAGAILDGQLMPAQYLPERIASDDVQRLLSRVRVRPSKLLSARFPERMPAVVRARLADGRTVSRATADFDGFLTRPPTLPSAARKLRALAIAFDPALVDGLVELVSDLERRDVAELMRLLARFNGSFASQRPAPNAEAHP